MPLRLWRYKLEQNVNAKVLYLQIVANWLMATNLATTIARKYFEYWVKYIIFNGETINR